jgi:uncharacterized membrane protein
VNLGASELLVLFFVVGVPVILVLAIARAARQGGPPARPADPVTVLDGRLARGEITPDEYDEARRRLG